MRPVIVERYTKKEMDVAVADLEKRGFELVAPPVHQMKEGKSFTPTSRKKRVAFNENIQDGKWLAKMRRVEGWEKPKSLMSGIE